MSPIHAYALAGAVLASITVWGFLQFPGLLVWCAFIGWAGYLHAGGTVAVMKNAIACLALGVLMGWGVSLVIATGVLPLPVPVAAGVLVAIVTPVMIWLSRYELFGIVPASFYGFASCFAFLAQTPGKFTVEALTASDVDNALIVVPVSLLIGVALGHLQTLFAGALMAKPIEAGTEA